jgi:hypothetical protein
MGSLGARIMRGAGSRVLFQAVGGSRSEENNEWHAIIRSAVSSTLGDIRRHNKTRPMSSFIERVISIKSYAASRLASLPCCVRTLLTVSKLFS